MDGDRMEHTHEELSGILNGQTGQLAWPELERHFARGVVIKVDSDLDLVKVASAVVTVRGWHSEKFTAAMLASSPDATPMSAATEIRNSVEPVLGAFVYTVLGKVKSA